MADDKRRAEQSKRMKCTRGLCDQRIPCAFYCWWNPTMRALNYQADQHG